MSRFNSLEFGDQFDDQLPLQRELVKGEAFYLAEARSAFENANFEQGLRLYSKVLEFNPENASAWTGQVRMLIELGEFREAKLWADKALERFPHEPELLAAKAVALGRSGDLQGALASIGSRPGWQRAFAITMINLPSRSNSCNRPSNGTPLILYCGWNWADASKPSVWWLWQKTLFSRRNS